MATYLLEISYTSAAWAAMLANPQDRSKAVAPAIKKLGGKIVGLWWAFSKRDAIAIIEMPDNVSVAAFSMAVAAGGSCKSFATTQLLSAADGIDAMKKASGSGYKPVSS
jgi:uncharacterized protein with GYD domain